MNLKIAVVLEKRYAKSNGLFPVKIRFNFDNQAFYINTNIEVAPANFYSGKIVGVPRAAMMNNVVAQKLDHVHNVMEDLHLRGWLKTKFKTGKELKAFIEAGEMGYNNLNNDERVKLHFKTYTENFLQKYSSKSSADQFRLMLKKVEQFGNSEQLFIPDINVGWLKDFETFCDKSGMSTNGTGVYMRAIRTIFNDAIDRELISLDMYPFRRFKIKKAKTKHRNVTVEDLRYMYFLDYDVFMADLKANAKKHTSAFPDVRRYVDLFFLSFFMCGINLKDLLFLKRADIRNGQLSILRAKTDTQIIIRIEPEAQAIMDRYRGKKYLLDFLDTYNTDDYRTMEHRMNRNIKLVLPFVTGYWGRHSWATLAGELDVPDPIIDIAQGRTTPGDTGTYVLRNVNKISEANRKVIDYLIKK